MQNSSLSYFGYAVLTLLAFFILRLAIPIGDHQFGMADGLLLTLFSAVFIFLFLIVLFRSLYRIYKKQGRFSWYPIVVFAVTSILSSLAFKTEDGKFWTLPSIRSYSDYKQSGKDGYLVLFKTVPLKQA